MRAIVRSLYRSVTSIKLSVALLLLYGIAIATGTFLEKGYGTDTAWALVYRSGWFELLHLLLAVNLISNIFIHRFYRLKKLPLLMFHLAFIVMLVGAGITRYAGYHAYMDVREAQSQNRAVSKETYLQVNAEKNGTLYSGEKRFLPSQIGGNDFELTVDVDGKDLTISSKTFTASVKKAVVADENGKPTLSFMQMRGESSKKHFMQSGEVVDTGSFKLYFDRESTDPYAHVQLVTKDDGVYLRTNTLITWRDMSGEESGFIMPGIDVEFKPKRVFSVGDEKIVPVDVATKGVVTVMSAEEAKDGADTLSALSLYATYAGVTEEATVMKHSGVFFGEKERLEVGDLSITLEWSSKIIELPFSIRLDDFYLKNFPGSKNLFSFGSHVTLSADDAGEIKHDIYKNNPLAYNSYKLFQSGYHPDEKGTAFLVNYDPGKWPTYVGYALLMAGLVLNLLNPYSRFGRLVRQKRRLGTIVAACVAVSLLSMQPLHADTPKGADAAYAEAFSSLLVQGRLGRIKPFDSTAVKLMNKLSGTTSLFGLSHNQVVTGMMAEPEIWKEVSMIKPGDRSIRSSLGIEKSHTFISYAEAEKKGWITTVAEAAKAAWLREEVERGVLEKEMIKLNERFNICEMVYNGALLKVFPLKDDPKQQWFTHERALEAFPTNQQQRVDTLHKNFMMALQEAPKKGDWSAAVEAVNEVKAYQQKNGGDILPSQFQVTFELLYNRLAVFEKLYPLYMITGMLLLVMTFARLLKPSLGLSLPVKIAAAVVVLGFAAHTLGLGMRWYIVGHAPWSNGYESMLYIAWTMMFAGILFARESEFALSSTAILSALALFVAHLSWMNPEMTNVDSSLQSYWMTIHVSVITASYGFLGLCALLGTITLLFFILHGRAGEGKEIEAGITELTRINEISMIVGLSLVTIGNFMGSIWANETWGRYWGWDPKETWALVSIVTYAAVLHMRLIPKLRSAYVFAAASLLSYSTVLMTYFGVNYYLFGKHGYAAGEPFLVPTWVYYSVVTIFVLILLAARNRTIWVKRE